MGTCPKTFGSWDVLTDSQAEESLATSFWAGGLDGLLEYLPTLSPSGSSVGVLLLFGCQGPLVTLWLELW